MNTTSLRLENQIAFVTGASRGIGRASALALAREGADVVIAARTENDLNIVAGEIRHLGRRALVAVGDLSIEADARRTCAEALAEFGRIDILVNNAGVGRFGLLPELTLADYDFMMNTNMRATFLCTHTLLPQMLERGAGSIVFIGSVAGLRGLPHETVYCATKHAQYGFATALDYECRERGVKVCYVAPGGVNSHFAFGNGRTEGDPTLQEYLDNEDVADAVIFAVTQPPKSRVFLIGMRPMREEL